MRDGSSKKNKLSWPKTLVKKWLNIKNKAEDFHADNTVYGGGDKEWTLNFSEREACTIKKSKEGSASDNIKRSNRRRNSDRVQRSKTDLDSEVTNVDNYRLFVGTWNVAGRSPPTHLNLDEWLHISPAEIYVLGFQEIVPLNAGNVLGTEDNGPARKWLSLIRRSLNRLPGVRGSCCSPSPAPHPIVELDTDFEGSIRQKASSFVHRSSFHSLSHSMRIIDNSMSITQPWVDRRFSFSDQVNFEHRPIDYDTNFRWGSFYDDENELGDSASATYYSTIQNGCFPSEDTERQPGRSNYCLVASKQMVGIFLTVWVKSDLKEEVHNIKVSCVGRGLMGYLGNKGSISISMSMHQTSFCFICSHLTSGQKEGDELRRNSDIMEILKKTRFPRVQGMGDENSHQTVLDHDRIIWLGDLNYRIALSSCIAKTLVEMCNWRALLENDQLQIEQRMGRVFEGWNEGKIYFPPTYKYSNNSDRFMGVDRHPKGKRRTPAWCDRILWYGRGLHQIGYFCWESKFSDHRPVYSIFSAEVETVNCSEIKKSMNCSNSRIKLEEVWPYSYRYTDLNFF